MSTPGQEALIEAMRLEQARIYSRTCPEHRNAQTTVDEQIVAAVDNGQTNTQIMATLHVSYDRVRAARKQAMAGLRASA